MKKLSRCPAEAVLGIIAGKWKCAILLHLKTRCSRSGALLQSLPMVSQKVLTQKLRQLESDGLITRIVYKEKAPMEVYYRLTNLGYSIIPVLHTLRDFGVYQLNLVGCLNCVSY